MINIIKLVVLCLACIALIGCSPHNEKKRLIPLPLIDAINNTFDVDVADGNCCTDKKVLARYIKMNNAYDVLKNIQLCTHSKYVEIIMDEFQFDGKFTLMFNFRGRLRKNNQLYYEKAIFLNFTNDKVLISSGEFTYVWGENFLYYQKHEAEEDEKLEIDPQANNSIGEAKR